MASTLGAYSRSIFLRRRWTVLTATPLLVTGWQWLVNHLGSLPDDLRTTSVWAAPWWAWVIGFLLCFAAAQFMAWNEENGKSLALQYELNELTLPQFRGVISIVNNHSPATVEPEFSCSVVLVAELYNVGAPSIADKYLLTANIDGHEIYGFHRVLPESLTLQGSYGEVKYFRADALPGKTVTPIPKGGKAAGVLWFLFKEVTPSPNLALSLTLSFCDVHGKRWYVKMPENDHVTATNRPIYNPGIGA